jgi:SAM-dependent methyltransferase
MELTDNVFWDDYWKNIRVPCRVNMSFSFERCLDKAFSNVFRSDPNKTLIEIGCAPGKWMVYFHERYGYKVAGLDSSQQGILKTLENLTYHKIDGKIYNEDFFRFQPKEEYDIVLSLGFIEHFDDVDRVIEKHLSLLRTGGLLVLGVPNFKGINKVIQKHVSEDILKKHNLNVMDRKFFEKLPERFPLETISVKYKCSFEPELFLSDKKLSIPFRAARKTFSLLRRSPIFDGVNSPHFSSYILAVFRYNKQENV